MHSTSRDSENITVCNCSCQLSVNSFEHSRGVRGTDMAGSRRIICLHISRAREQWHVLRTFVSIYSNASRPTGRCEPGGGGRGRITDEQGDYLVGGGEVTLVSTLLRLKERRALDARKKMILIRRPVSMTG